MDTSRSLRRSILAVALLALSASAAADPLADDIAALAHGWAHANYQVPDAQKDAAFADLQARAHLVSQRFPGRAEPLIWEGIIASSHAKYQSLFAAGKTAAEARDLLLAAQKIDPNALDGASYVSLGALYYKVPGWPLSFGDKDKAASLLQQALKLDPAGIDPNYFYGDFLLQRGDRSHAAEYLHRALAAPARVGREDADAGRRADIEADLKKLAG